MLGLDGVPHSLALRLIEQGVMPNLGALAEAGDMARIHSVFPTVSGVAWSAFQTGKNPGKFGVFGFVELDSALNLRIQSATDLKARTIWDIVSDAGKKVVALGVPMSYPPHDVNGIMVGGFLAPSLEKAVRPPSALRRLKETGYVIDIDPALGRRDIDAFKKQLLEVFEARVRTVLALMDEQKWDLFVAHVMDTDRINHFMWRWLEEDGSENQRFFLDFYRRIDRLVGEVAAHLKKNDMLMILSDHGFCRIKYEVQLNAWLRENGFLDWEGEPEHDFTAISPDSRAVALVPGRIHVLTEGFWSIGSGPRAKIDEVKKDLMGALATLTDPETGSPICRNVMTREEAFSGPHTDRAPDIVIDPHDGYDLKAKLTGTDVFTHGPINGMHTYNDALMCVSPGGIKPGSHGICDASATVLSMLGLEPPEDFDGESVI